MNKSRLISAFSLLFLLLAGAIQAQDITQREYIDRYKNVAIKKMQQHGIPASITLAQGILESRYGNSRLAKEANNHFAIKATKDWTGGIFKEMDNGKLCDFRKYKTVDDSFEDHSNFLRYRERYKKLFDLKPTDYQGWAHGLKAAGYAEDPQYPQKLIKLIEEYQLYQYDKGIDIREIPPSPLELQKVTELKPLNKSPLYKFSTTRKLFSQNGTAFIIANNFDSYKSLAKEYNLSRRELLRFNDLKKDPNLEAGTVVYVQKKALRTPRNLDMHVMEEGQTLYQVSQKYGVQLKKLYKYNNLKSSEEPQEGSLVKLR